MAKKNNKGFSLVEIVIAIAILTVLLTPVVKQLAQTMSVHRIAKEQQYVTENAEYILSYFQRNDLETLKDTSASNEMHCTAEPTSVTQTCDLYTSSSLTTPIATVTYNMNVYTLADKYLGSSNTGYIRSVIMDDLSNKISAENVGGKSYRINYDFSDSSAPADYQAKGFTLTNEGSLVMYESVTNASGDELYKYVKGIVCKEIGDYADYFVEDPNTVNLGNMHDLNADQVALITGQTTNYDRQAEIDLYAKAMDELKKLDPAKWEIQMFGASGGILSQAAYLNSMKKLTKIYVDYVEIENGVTLADKDKYYLVKADVYYQNSFALEDGTAHVNKMTYNVFSQKFYTKNCPEIYYEYQPFAVEVNNTTKSVTYAAKEYLLIDNYVDGAKMYLYKPRFDQATITANGIVPSYDDTSTANLYVPSNSMYKIYNNNPSNSSEKKVQIYFANTNGGSASGNWISDTSVKPIDIYTNLTLAGINDTSDGQILCNNVSAFSAFNYVISDKTVINTSGKTQAEIDSEIAAEIAKRATYSHDGDNHIYELAKDSSTESRLFTVTVILEPKDGSGNSVVLTGAKGE